MTYTHSYQDIHGEYTHVFYNIYDKKITIVITEQALLDNVEIDYFYLPIYHDSSNDDMLYHGLFNIESNELLIKGRTYGKYEYLEKLALSIVENKIFENI